MNQQYTVQIAVICLTELDAHPGEVLSCKDISRKQGIPLAECVCVIQRLSRAGIVELAAAGQVILRRPIEEVTALELLEAVWTREDIQPAFQMLVGAHRGLKCRKTLEFVRWATESGLNG